MKKQRLFGTDGVRGIANVEITPNLAYNLGKAGAFVLAKSTNKPLFIVGTDTRISKDLLSHALISGLLSCNANVIDVGIIPTPAIPFLIKKYNATAGVMISASHNPYNYNGIKFFNEFGYKLSDKIEDEIQNLIENNFEGVPTHINDEIGTSKTLTEANDVYIKHILSSTNSDLSSLNIALDCANGSTYAIAKDVFERLGAQVAIINNDPDGLNINKYCGSTHLEPLREFIINGNFDMGFAFDGDGDRCLAVDNKGNVVNGDKILAICGRLLENQDKLAKNTVVATVMSNLGLHKSLNNTDIKTVCTKVGDRYVLEEMLKSGYNFGGEESGHIIFLDYNTTGDGVLTAVQMASMVKESNKDLEELSSVMVEYPQTLINITVANNIKHLVYNDSRIQDIINIEEATLNGDGRILVRISGTEPLIRVMVEGSNTLTIEGIARRISEKVKEVASIF